MEPTEAVQREAGRIEDAFPNPGNRSSADPWIIAEALIGGHTVVTYEGRTFSGVPHRRWARSMPGICQHFSVACCTLPEALAELGANI